MTNLIATARHLAVLEAGKDDPEALILIKTINNLKKSRNASKLKAKWQQAIDAVEASRAAL